MVQHYIDPSARERIYFGDLMFGDIIDNEPVEIDGVPHFRITFIPSEDLVKAYDIKESDLSSVDRSMTRSFPQNICKQVGFKTGFRRWFCFQLFDGRDSVMRNMFHTSLIEENSYLWERINSVQTFVLNLQYQLDMAHNDPARVEKKILDKIASIIEMTGKVSMKEGDVLVPGSDPKEI